MTSSSSTSSPHQKPLKKRLAAVARKTHNRVCCDCPEKAPTWAVILPPPEIAPLSSRDLVAFVCFNCASIHRQLGMSLVRSIALDEWTEYDVESAEQSGNKYVNRIYEGNLKEKDTHSDTDVMLKPIAGAHIASRQRFIKEKYVQQTYYSQAAHFQHVAQRKIEPSTPSKSSRRSSLMVFLKSKDSPSADKVAAAFAKADEGTISTSPSTGTYHDAKNLHHAFPMPVPFDSDLASVQQQQHDHQPQQQQQQQRRTSLIPFSLSSSLTTTESSSPTKTPMRPRVSIFSKRTSIVDLHSSDTTGWDLATSTKDDSSNVHSISQGHSDRSDRKVSSKASSDQKKRRSSGRDNKEGRGQSLERELNDDDQEIDISEPPNQHQKASPAAAPSLTTSLDKLKGLKPSKRHDNYRDPRRANFHGSTGSIDFNLADDNDDDANTRISAPVSSMARTGIVPATPRTPKPVLVASSVSTPSPTNSRMYLYAKHRGRSQSRARDKAVDSSPGTEEKKTSSTTTTRSRRVDRGRSTSAKPRHASPDKSRASTNSDRPSSHKKEHSKRSTSTPATLSTNRTARSTRDRTSGGGSSRVTSSPLRIHQGVSRSKTGTEGEESAKQHRSKSSTRHRSSDDTKDGESRPRSSSARPRTDRTESRRRDDTRQRSSSARPRSDRVDKPRPRSSRNDASRETEAKTEKKATTTTTTPTTPSSSRRSPSRSRSTRDGDGKTRSARSTDRSQSRSKVESRGRSIDDTKSSRVRRDNGTQRSTRERTRSRSRSVDTLGELKRATTRRQSRSSDAIQLSESMNSKVMAHWDDSTDSHGLVLDESIRTKEPSTQKAMHKSKVDDSSQSQVTSTKTPQLDEHIKVVIKRRSSHNSCSSASGQSENSNGTSTKPARTRRVSRGSDAATKLTTAAPTETSKPKPLSSFLDKSLEGVVHEGETGQSQPKDTPSLSSGTRQDNLDDNTSLSLESALLPDEKSIKTAQDAKRSKRESILKEGEESFQVISAPGRSFKLNSRDKAKPTALASFGRSYNSIGAGGAALNDVDETDESSKRHGGGHDAFEKSKLRLSRGKAAARNAERSSRKNEILAALDQTTPLSDDEWVGAPLRVVPERSKSTSATVAVAGSGGGALRPMIRRSAPAKSRSEIGTKLSTNPSLVLSKVKVDAVDRRPGRSENARREGLHQSFN